MTRYRRFCVNGVRFSCQGNTSHRAVQARNPAYNEANHGAATAKTGGELHNQQMSAE